MTPHLQDHDQKTKLRGRIRRFYRHFDEKDWEACYNLLDPKLRSGKVNYTTYAKSLSEFFCHYGPIKIVAIPKLTVYADVRDNKHDDRDFAYGLVVWQDKSNQHHLLRERWVRSGENWFTRMAGLVTNERESP